MQDIGKFVQLSTGGHPATRWGICSAGKISHDFVNSLRLFPKEEHQVVAIAARSLEKAQEFAKKFDIPQAYGLYDDLAKDPNIDIVYVGPVNNVHYPVCKMLLNAGKNILCEKPMTLNSREAKEILALAKEKNVFFMEGFWSRFFPAYKQLKTELQEGTIGEPRFVNVTFGMDALHIERIYSRELGGGAIMDIGCYAVQFIMFVFNEKPEKILAAGHLQPTGMDDSTGITMIFPRGRVATIQLSASCKMAYDATVYGSEGTIQMPGFPHPIQLITPKQTYDFPLPAVESEPMVFPRCQGMVYQIQAVRQSLIKGEKENAAVPHSESERIMAILEEIRKQTGVWFEADK